MIFLRENGSECGAHIVFDIKTALFKLSLLASRQVFAETRGCDHGMYVSIAVSGGHRLRIQTTGNVLNRRLAAHF